MVGDGDAIQFKFGNIFFQGFEAKIEMTVTNGARNCVDVEVNFFNVLNVKFRLIYKIHYNILTFRWFYILCNGIESNKE